MTVKRILYNGKVSHNKLSGYLDTKIPSVLFTKPMGVRDRLDFLAIYGKYTDLHDLAVFKLIPNL